MAFGPPSYQAAAYRQLWPIIAPHVQIDDLYSACLVCRQWNSIFTPLLWGNPARLFGTDSDTIYLSLTKFKRRLSRVRFEIRSLVHTLHIPPAQPELYDGPQAGWFRDILNRLPNLQALVVRNLSFFDHQSLQSIHQNEDQAQYPLRLLIASQCENTTPSSLSTAILHFPDLIYLDLSSAHGSRNPYVLQQIGTLSELRVLKLQNSGLRDDDLEYLTFPDTLRSLDMSKNLLTERGVANIINRLPAAYIPHRQSIIARRYSGVPLPLRVLDEGIETFVCKHLTSGLDGYLQIEEGIPQNFTHLYLSSNNLTVDGLTKLENYPSLQHLDCGSLSLSQPSTGLLSPHSPTQRFSDQLLGKEILSPVLFCNAFRNLRSLRMHHSVITTCPFSGTEVNTISDQCFELPDEDLRFELDSTELAVPGASFELEDTSSNIRYELPEGDPTAEPLQETHPTFETPDDVGKDITPPISPVSPISPAFPAAPLDTVIHGARENSGSHNIFQKPVPFGLSISKSPNHTSPEETPNPSTSVPLGPEAFTYKYHQGEEQPWQKTLPLRQKARTIKELIDEIKLRAQRTNARERPPGHFKPSMLPNLKRLILTDIPSVTRERRIVNSLTMFIQENAEDEELARLEYLRLWQDENSVPDWKGVGEGKITGTLKLHQLILEIVTENPFLPQYRNGNHPSKRLSFSKSSTEDPDSEMFMHATEGDFSFFGEDDGGLLVSDGRLDRMGRVEGGLLVEAKEDEYTERNWDVVRELAMFRKERKGAFEKEDNKKWGRASGVDLAFMGHWRGSIKVVKEVAV